MKAQESAGTLALGKCNHYREAYVLDVAPWTGCNYHDSIDLYNGWSLKATMDGGSGSSLRCQVMSGSLLPPWQFWHWPTPRETSWGMDGHWSMGSAVEIWRTGSLLDVLLFLFASLGLFFWSRPGINGDGTGFTTYQWRWSSPVHHICEKVVIVLKIGSETYGFIWTRTWQECTMLPSLPFCFLLYSYAAQNVRA